jgi:hypothetical protein
MSDILDRINRTGVPPELLAEAIEMHADLPAEERGNFAAVAARLAELLEHRGLAASDLALAIDCRVRALARLMATEGARGWVMAGEPSGPSYINAALVQIAADEPLIEIAHEPGFDPESFRKRVLRISAARGTA